MNKISDYLQQQNINNSLLVHSHWHAARYYQYNTTHKVDQTKLVKKNHLAFFSILARRTDGSTILLAGKRHWNRWKSTSSPQQNFLSSSSSITVPHPNRSEDDTQSNDTQSIESHSRRLTTDTQSANDVHSGLTFQLNLKFPGGQNSSSCLSRDPRDLPQAWPII